MAITHVLRGADHISNTPTQLALYRAIGAQPPVFGHVPMINGPDGKKLSKRHGATAVGDYQHMGILPAAMRNFLALLGWSPGGDREIMTLDEMIGLFSLEGIQKKPAIFDMTKLEWMNGQYLSMASADELYPLVSPQLEQLGLNGNKDAVLKAIAAVKTRSRTTLDVAKQVAVRLDAKFVAFDDKAIKEIAKDPAGYKASLEASVAVLRKTDWTPEALEKTLRALADEKGVAAGKIFQPIRITLADGTMSEAVNELSHVVGHVVTHSIGAHAQPVHLGIDSDRVFRRESQGPAQVSEHRRPADERVAAPSLRQQEVADCGSGVEGPQRER